MTTRPDPPTRHDPPWPWDYDRRDYVGHAWAMHSMDHGLYQTAVMANGEEIELFDIFRAGYDLGVVRRLHGEG